MENPFFGREKELESLKNLVNSPMAQLGVVFGARQSGKTALLRAALAAWQLAGTQPPGLAVFWTARPDSPDNLLRSFSQTLFQALLPGAKVDPWLSYGSWERVWDELSKASADRRVVLVLDDAFELLRAVPGWLRSLQQAWSQKLRGRSQLVLLLAGTPLGPAQWQALARPTGLLRQAGLLLEVPPLPYAAVQAWFADCSPQEQIQIYAASGGLPGALALVEQRRQVEPHSPALRLLAQSRLAEQFAAPHTYQALLRVLARHPAGVSLGDLARLAGVPRSNVLKYLHILIQMGWASRSLPPGVPPSAASRKGRYTLPDAALRFFFCCLDGSEPAQHADITRFIAGDTLPTLCQERLARAASAGRLPFSPETISLIWEQTTLQAGTQALAVAISHRQRAVAIAACPGQVHNQALTEAWLETTARRLIPASSEPETWRIYPFTDLEQIPV